MKYGNFIIMHCSYQNLEQENRTSKKFVAGKSFYDKVLHHSTKLVLENTGEMWLCKAFKILIKKLQSMAQTPDLSRSEYVEQSIFNLDILGFVDVLEVIFGYRYFIVFWSWYS